MPTVSFSGIASGIDGDSIIQALLDARRLASIPIENKVTRNDTESTALEEFNTKLLTLDDMLKEFTTLAGGAVSKIATSSDEDTVTAVASGNAVSATVELEVLNLAKTASISFNDRFSDLDAPVAPGLTGPTDIEITLGTGDSQETVQVTIDQNTTLSQLVLDINDQSPSRLQASVINTGSLSSPEYAFILQGLQTGEENGTMSVNIPPELSGLGVFQSSNVSQAEDAVIDMAGIGQVRRASNLVNDLVPGLSIELKRDNVGPVTISVANDADKTGGKISEFVEAFNDVVRYSNENDLIERVENEDDATNVYGSLARTRVDDRAIDAIKTALSSASFSGESEIKIFADLGIKTERDGTLSFDQETFNNAVSKDSGAVGDILNSFADSVSTSSGIISEYTKFQGTIDRAIDTNNDENTSLNEKLARLERSLETQKETMEKIFANLESTTARLQSSGEALSGILAGLQNG
jgi:flagellar hook-associated protein 2